MDLLDLVEPTTLCVSLLLLALGLLWAYVSLSNNRPDQPSLAVLYEPLPPKGANGKKNNKQRLRKQEASPRAAPKPRPAQPEPPAKKPAKPPSLEATTKSDKETATKKKRPISEQPPRDDKTPEEVNEGEWQTQLSRQQLRAMRQKQRQEEKVVSSDKVKEGSSSEEQLEDKPSSEEAIVEDSSGDNKPASYSKGGRRAKSKKTAPKAETKSSKDTSADDNKEVGASSQPTDERLPSPCEEKEISTVEKALQEAAESLSPSPEEEPAVAVDEGEFSTVKPKKQKKSRRKSPNKDNEDEWVHVDFPGSA